MKLDARIVRTWLEELQDAICTALERADGEIGFREDPLETGGGGLSRPRVLEGGPVIERAAVNFSHTRGASLPGAASARRPELAGREYEAVSVSLIVHPRNPYAPTSHANLRFFLSTKQDADPIWWFGGGFDMTPYYGFEEDAVHWHATAREAAGDLYPEFKLACDEYFFLKHRAEPRGIGGVFFDDFDRGGFEQAFSVTRRIGDAFLPAYLPILENRKGTPYGERERSFQTWRRGRYVEFNLIQDRGTLFGLQAGGRTEAILASLPPEVTWRYDWHPEPNSPEEELFERFLVPRDWLA